MKLYGCLRRGEIRPIIAALRCLHVRAAHFNSSPVDIAARMLGCNLNSLRTRTQSVCARCLIVGGPMFRFQACVCVRSCRALRSRTHTMAPAYACHVRTFTQRAHACVVLSYYTFPQFRAAADRCATNLTTNAWRQGDEHNYVHTHQPHQQSRDRL